ncbi:MAG: hypothetical protein ACLGGO_21805 [Coleofasciculus sp.]
MIEKSLFVPAPPFYLEISNPGILDELTLQPTTRQPPASGEVEKEAREQEAGFISPR